MQSFTARMVSWEWDSLISILITIFHWKWITNELFPLFFFSSYQGPPEYLTKFHKLNLLLIPSLSFFYPSLGTTHLPSVYHGSVFWLLAAPQCPCSWGTSSVLIIHFCLKFFFMKYALKAYSLRLCLYRNYYSWFFFFFNRTWVLY